MRINFIFVFCGSDNAFGALQQLFNAFLGKVPRILPFQDGDDHTQIIPVRDIVNPLQDSMVINGFITVQHAVLLSAKLGFKPQADRAFNIMFVSPEFRVYSVRVWTRTE